MPDPPAPPRPVRLTPLPGAHLAPGRWRGVVVRALRAFRDQGMTDWAATLAYHAILALVPVLLVAAALLTLVGSTSLPTTIADEFSSLIQDRTSGSTASASADAVHGLVQQAMEQARGGASVTLAISLLLAMNGASGAFAAAGRALNRVHHVEESRGFVRHKLADVGTALLTIVLLALAAALFVVGGGIADSAFSWVGLDRAPIVWSILRIPVGLGALLLAIGIVYARAPDREDRRLRLVTPGAISALIVWGLASLGFAVYVVVAGFGSAYGALGGAIVLLFWLWLSAAALLLGAQIDAELERTRLVEGEAGGAPLVPPPSATRATDQPSGG